MGSFKVLAPSGHRVVWTHLVGETKTCNFLRTRQTASAVIKHRGPSRSCRQIGGGSRKILINSMVSTKTHLNSPSETSHSSLVSSVEHLQTGAARSRNGWAFPILALSAGKSTNLSLDVCTAKADRSYPWPKSSKS